MLKIPRGSRHSAASEQVGTIPRQARALILVAAWAGGPLDRARGCSMEWDSSLNSTIPLRGNWSSAGRSELRISSIALMSGELSLTCSLGLVSPGLRRYALLYAVRQRTIGCNPQR